MVSFEEQRQQSNIHALASASPSGHACLLRALLAQSITMRGPSQMPPPARLLCRDNRRTWYRNQPSISRKRKERKDIGLISICFFFSLLNLWKKKKKGLKGGQKRKGREDKEREKKKEKKRKEKHTDVIVQGQSRIVIVSPLRVAVYSWSLYRNMVGAGQIVVNESTTETSAQDPYPYPYPYP